MAVSEKLKGYLDREGVAFEHAEHALTYTASETASAQHIPGKNFLKSVIVKFEEKPVMCVLPATHLVDFEKLKSVLGTDSLQLASEEELASLFPDYEVGAEPPFGNLYGLDVYMETVCQEDLDVAFNAGTHTDVVRIKLDDYVKLVNPTIAEFGKHV